MLLLFTAFKYVWVIDEACLVKMAGYWPSSFFVCSLDGDGVEVHKLARKVIGQYLAILTEQIHKYIQYMHVQIATIYIYMIVSVN